MSERFYQRAMSGDHEEIVAAAHVYLKRKSFARYCDKILIPALQLASADLAKHSITPQQQATVKSTIARVIESLGTDACRPSFRIETQRPLQQTTPFPNAVGADQCRVFVDIHGRVVEQVYLWNLQCRGCAVLTHFADDLATKDAHGHKC